MESNLLVWTFCFFFIVSVRDVGAQRYNTIRVTTSRSTVFVPRIISKTCLLKPDTGPCRGSIRMYYFDPETMSCSKFEWGGCMGNGNRFDTMEACLDSCKSKIGVAKPRPRWCSLRFDYGFCFGALDRWYYDPLWKVCKKTIYSGCGGNKNNFYNLEQCEEVCRFGHNSLATKQLEDKNGLKKVIIINPYNTTPKRGKVQTTKPTGVVPENANGTTVV